VRGSLIKRGDRTYAIVVDLPRRQNGKRNQSWTTFHGTRKQAEAELARTLLRLSSGIATGDDRITMAEVVEDHWKPWARNRASAKTFERWEDMIRRFILPAFSETSLGKLTPAMIQRTYLRWQESGGYKGSPLAGQTVLHHHRLLFHVLHYAVRLQVLSRNVAELVEPPKVERREMTALDETQAVRLIRSMVGTPMEVPVLLAIATGLRRGEVCGLKWTDIDFEAAILAVRRSLEETRAGIRFKDPKALSSRRTIALEPELIEALQSHKARQAKLRRSLGSRWNDVGVVFPDPVKSDGSPWRPDRFFESFRYYARKSDVPRVRFHDLRHSHATHLLRAGVHLKVASARLGHSTTKLTADTYSHVLSGMDRDASAMVGRRLREAAENLLANR